MSEWDFLWGLTGEELIDAMYSGGTKEDWAYVSEQERLDRIEELTELWGLTKEEMDEAIDEGITKKDWEYLSDEEKQERKEELASLRRTYAEEYDEVEQDEDFVDKCIDEIHRLALKSEWDDLKFLRDNNKITKEEFKRRRSSLFTSNNRK
ncbi:MAG: hypothetical protein KMY54_01595 [Erysipelothrix sp.]|nr:hypothetical protein [Erysipelothrix sp.]